MERWLTLLGIVVIGILTAVFFLGVHQEITNPCVRYGERYVSHFRKISDTITMPVYTRDCLERTNP